MSDGTQDTGGMLPTIPQIPAYNMRGQDAGQACGDGTAPSVNGSTGAMTQLTTGLIGGGSAQAPLLGQAHWVGVGRLTPGFIHEINNGLCVIANHVQLLMLQSERRDRDILRPLQVISSSLDHVEMLMHRFSTYARSAQHPPCRLRLNQVVDNAVALLEHLRAFRGLQIQKAFAHGLPEIEADQGPLTDAIVAILSASAQAIPRGGTLTISTHSSPGWVMIGFTRAGQWPQCSDESLTLARQIVEHLGGRVVRETQPGPTEGQLSVWLRAAGGSSG